MGIFLKSFSSKCKQGRERARNEVFRNRDENDIPVKLIEPSTGKIVELEVTEQNEWVAQMYMEQLKTTAKCLEKYGVVEWTVTGKTIRLVFDDVLMAENTRQAWRK